MFTIIAKDADGHEIVLRENVLSTSDVMFRGDYVAMKLWTRENIKKVLVSEGYTGSEEEIDVVLNEGIHELTTITNADDDVIGHAVWLAANHGKISKQTAEGRLLSLYGMRPAECGDCLYFNSVYNHCNAYGEMTHCHSTEAKECTHYLGSYLRLVYDQGEGGLWQDLGLVAERAVDYRITDLLPLLREYDESTNQFISECEKKAGYDANLFQVKE